jgi:hypothetical protein
MVANDADGIRREHTPMTLQQLRERATALTHRREATRERLAAALKSMDYRQALSRQVELDHIESELANATSSAVVRLRGAASAIRLRFRCECD